MKKQVLSDAGVGRALFTTRFRLSLQAVLMCLTGGVGMALLVFAVWFVRVTPHDLDVTRGVVFAKLVPADAHRKWRVSVDGGERQILTVERPDGVLVQYLTPAEATQLLKAHSSAYGVFLTYVYGSLVAFAVGAFAVYTLLVRLGSGSQDNQRIRGAMDLVPPKELTSLVEEQGASPYCLVDVPLPLKAPMQGILVEGSQGTGKSLALHDLMTQVFKRKRKCVIYDQSGEFYKAYFRPGKDHFFNPGLLGSVPWSIFSELRYTYDADRLAQAFLPPKAGVVAGANAFFEDAARALFSVILLRMTERGALYTADIARAFLEMPDVEMEHLIKQSVASSAVGGDAKGQRQGVISSIAIYLNGIRAVAPGSWSINEFMAADDDARLFILGTADTKAMFAPLYRLVLTLAFSAIASKQEVVHEDKYWFFLDEVHALGDIQLDEHAALLRKNGVCIATGIQSESQFVASIGKERSETLLNCFNTALMLRSNEPEMQDRCAKRLSRIEMDTVSRNQALAVAEWRDGAGLNRTEHEKWLVMPAEIGALADMNGYLRLAGELPATKVDYQHWLPKKPGAKARVSKFSGIQELPARNPAFEVKRGSSEDVLASLTAEVKALKASQSEDQPETTEAAGKSPARAVVVTEDRVVSLAEVVEAAHEVSTQPPDGVSDDPSVLAAGVDVQVSENSTNISDGLSAGGISEDIFKIDVPAVPASQSEAEVQAKPIVANVRKRNAPRPANPAQVDLWGTLTAPVNNNTPKK